MTHPNDGTRAGGYSAAGLAVITAVIVLAVNIGVGAARIDVGTELIDTDGFMRYARVLDLVQGRNGWFDGWIYWSNTPFGHSMHWTRPLDTLIVVLSAPLAPFMGWRDAVYWGALASGPLIHLLFAVAMYWAARALVGSLGAVIAALAASLQPVIVSYTTLGRADHHVLILAVSVITMGAVLRILAQPDADQRRAADIAGLSAALSLWISTEALLITGLALGALVVAWIVEGGRPSTVRRFSVSFAAATVVAALLELGPAHLFDVEYDRISLPHLVLAIGLAVVWSILDRVSPRLTTSWRPRLLASAAAGVALLVTLRLWFPLILGGPFAALPDRLRTQWLDYVQESRPMWADGGGAVKVTLQMGLPIVVAVALLATWPRWSRWVDVRAWIALTAWLLVLIPTALQSSRFSLYPEALAGIPVGVFIAARLTDGRSHRFPMLRRAGLVLLAAGSYLLPAVVMQLIVPSEPAAADSACPLSTVAPTIEGLRARLDTPDRPTSVLANLDDGPELHVRTVVDVVATPHHRNVDGIIDSYRTFQVAPDDARAIIARRGIDLVLICPARDERQLQPYDDDSLITLLLADTPPSWLDEVPTDDTRWRLYEVTG